MAGRVTTRLASLALAAAVMLGGCATIRRSEARDTEQLLAAAGFRMQPADTPEQQKRLETMPPYRLWSHTTDGNVVYTYADPENCRCLYLGGSAEYSAYQRLLTERQIQQIRRIQDIPRHLRRAGEARGEHDRDAATASRSTSHAARADSGALGQAITGIGAVPARCPLPAEIDLHDRPVSLRRARTALTSCRWLA